MNQANIGVFGRLGLVIRAAIACAVLGVVALVVGIIGVVQDARASHANFALMEIEDFRKGDILCGLIGENLGSAITERTTEYTYGIQTKSYDSAEYYVIPYFDSDEDAIPRKIILYKTGNKEQLEQLARLEDETWDFYFGEIDHISSFVKVERAEVVEMTAEDRGYLREFLKSFVEYYYDGYDTGAIYREYMDVVVPYVIRYNSGQHGVLIGIGVAAFAVAGILLAITLVQRQKAAAAPPVMQQPVMPQGYVPPVEGQAQAPVTQQGYIPPVAGQPQQPVMPQQTSQFPTAPAVPPVQPEAAHSEIVQPEAAPVQPVSAPPESVQNGENRTE